MKITQLSIKNFKSVEELVIRDIEDVLILVGRNNAGKSVMLDAIRAVSGDYAISEADFHHRDGNITIGGSSRRATPRRCATFRRGFRR